MTSKRIMVKVLKKEKKIDTLPSVFENIYISRLSSLYEFQFVGELHYMNIINFNEAEKKDQNK